MKNQKLIRKYTGAIFEIACEKDCIETYKGDLKSIADAFSISKDLSKVFGDSKISPAQKKEIFKGVFEQTISKECLTLSYLIFDKGRESILPYLYEDYVALMEKRSGLVKGVVTTPYQLDDSGEKQFFNYINSLGYSNLSLTFDVEPSLVQGFTIKIEDKILDNSLQGRLRRLRDVLEQ